DGHVARARVPAGRGRGRALAQPGRPGQRGRGVRIEEQEHQAVSDAWHRVLTRAGKQAKRRAEHGDQGHSTGMTDPTKQPSADDPAAGAAGASQAAGGGNGNENGAGGADGAQTPPRRRGGWWRLARWLGALVLAVVLIVGIALGTVLFVLTTERGTRYA